MARKFVLGEAGARKLRALLNGRGESGAIRRNGTGLAFEDDYALPFAVRWAQSAEEGEGAWIIWLPDDELVVVDGVAVDAAEDLTEVGGEYPEGWYVLDDDILDRDEGGELYIAIHKASSEGGVTHDAYAEFSGIPELGASAVYVKICTAEVSEAGVRNVKQYVTSAIVAGDGDNDSTDHYDCDDRSISRVQSSDGETDVLGNYFFLNGFGTFTVPGLTAPYGFYSPPTETALELDGDATSFAVLCRTGNSSSPNQNFLEYRRIKLVDSAGSSPFKYEKTTTTDPETGEPVTLHKLVNCCFYWNGELKTLADYDVSALLGGGTVYLRGTQAAPSASAADPTWTWTLGSSLANAPTGGKVLNFKLYDFAQSKVAVDYRTTFLALEDHTQKAKVTIAKPSGGGSIVLDASGDKPKMVISDGTKSVTIDLAGVPNTCSGGVYALHEIKYKDSNGDVQIYHGLFCADIDLTGIAAEPELAKIFSKNGSKVADIAASANIDITEKTLSAGTGIRLTQNGNTIVISVIGGGGETSGFSGTRTVLADTCYDMTDSAHPKLQRRYYTETWEDGLLKSSVLGSWETYHEPVEETVSSGGGS